MSRFSLNLAARHIHTMPNDNPGDLDPVTVVALAVFIPNETGVPSSKTPLSTDATAEAETLFTDAKPE